MFKLFHVLLNVTLITVLEIDTIQDRKRCGISREFSKIFKIFEVGNHMLLIFSSKFFYNKDVFAVIF